MIDPTYETGNVRLFLGDCLDVLAQLESNSVDAIVTDPPYELGFMGKSWDATGIAYNVEVWGQVLRVLKPGGHLLAFSGSRTYHRMACAIEDAGFQIRDQIMWLYGSGFPKSLNIGKALEAVAQTGSSSPIAQRKAAMGDDYKKTPLAGTENYGTTGNFQNKNTGNAVLELTDEHAKQWQGWGTALKPAHEPIVLARKPFAGTVANNVLQHGTGGINIDGSRIGTGTGETKTVEYPDIRGNNYNNANGTVEYTTKDQGRWPANVIHDGSDEVVDGFPDNGSAARFFYCAKANKRDRNEGLDGFEVQRRAGLQGADNDKESLDPVSERFRTQPSANNHPTVKPVDLMRYLVKLITPPEGVVLDPFMGSGSTGKGAVIEGFNFVGIEQDADYLDIARARIVHAQQPKQQPGLFDD